MKYTLSILALLFLGYFGKAQQQNVFLEGDYWTPSTSVQQVKEKINEGNSPSALTSYGFDATTYAILGEAPLPTIKYLLSLEGNEVNKYTHDGRNYLMWAAYKGNTDLMKYLYTKDSKTDIIDDHGYNLVNFAAAGGNTNKEVYDLMVKNGSDLTSTTRQGQNILLLLIGNAQSLNDLSYFTSQGLDLNHVDNEGNNAFLYAARYGNIPVMIELLERGFDALYKNKNGENAVLMASRGARRSANGLDVFTYLESLGLEATVLSDDNNSALHYLARGNENEDVYTFFLKKDINPELVNESGANALMNAFWSNNETAIQVLKDEISNLNQANNDGYSALTYAVRNQSEKYTEWLLEKGADATIIDAEGNNLVTHLYETTTNETTYFDRFQPVFQQKGLKTQPQVIHIAVQKQSPFLVEQALAARININAENDNGNTPLQVAAMKASDVEFIRFLIGHGADKTVTTEFGETAYDLASENELLNGDVEFLNTEG